MSYLLLAYPQYQDDTLIESGKKAVQGTDGTDVISVYKSRMKPPICRLRVGELWGNSNDSSRDGLLGFLNSLSYNFPDESPWEYRKGQRVPKMIDVEIEYKIMHDEVPSLDTTDFYGYYPNLLSAKFDKTSMLAKAGEVASLGANLPETDDFFD